MMIAAPKFIARVIDELAAERPFLMSRWGHCESRILGYRDFFDRGEVDKTLKLQLGHTTITDEQLLEMQDSLLKAFLNTDIYGLSLNTVVKNDLDLLWQKIPEIAKIRGVDLEKAVICSPNIHIRMLEEGLFHALLRPAKKILLITCRNLEEFFPSYFDKSKDSVEIIYVPQEARTDARAKSLVPGSHYPDHFYEIIQALNGRSLQGVLCLYGAGFLGKVYGSIAKSRGAVAVDIGSVFDAWGGVMGRSFMNKYYLKKYAINDYEY
jgi:hypothetical protein